MLLSCFDPEGKSRTCATAYCELMTELPKIFSPKRGKQNMVVIKTLALFFATAIAEIVGCYLPYLWLRKEGSIWLLILGAVSLTLFAWLLTLHPAAAGRVYAAYGGVYISVALIWLWLVDGVPLSPWDITGAAVALLGMGIIVWGGWQS